MPISPKLQLWQALEYRMHAVSHGKPAKKMVYYLYVFELYAFFAFLIALWICTL